MIVVNQNYLLYPSTCERKQILNGERTLTFTTTEDVDKEMFESIQIESHVELDDEEYIVKVLDKYMKGNRAAKQVTAIHVFFIDLKADREDKELKGDIYLKDALNLVFNGLQWKYELYVENTKFNFESFGKNNKLAIFQDILTNYDLEYKLDTPNRVVKIYPRIGEIVEYMFRYNYNIKTLKLTEDSNDLTTVCKGYGLKIPIIGKRLQLEYVSPNAKKFGRIYAEPVDDEKLNLLALWKACKNKVKDEPSFEVEIDVSFVDEHYIPNLGDSVLTVHERLNIDLDTRITEITDYPFNKTKKTQVVLSNISQKEVMRIKSYMQISVLQKSNNTLLTQYKEIKDKTTDLDQKSTSLDTRVKALEIMKLNDIEVVITKPPFNAVGDGVTDNTPVIQSAIDYLESKGGGTLRFPSGVYVVNGSIDIPSNITIIGTGVDKTVLKKTMDANIVYLFTIGRTRGTPGYGGGGNNITFENIQFEGTANSDTQYMPLSLTFNHAENVIIRNCRFLNCITRDHAIDLGGCNRILIEKCSFEGAYHIATREYNEAIQIDSSVPGGITDFINYDGLPTKDVTVRDCQFLPVYAQNGSVIRYAPNPIGNHGFTGGKHYSGILFENNLVKDCWGHGTTNPATDWYAWIHFYALSDSKFLNNTFINSYRQNSNAMGFHTTSNGCYDPVTLVSGTGTPLQHTNIEIAGNTFKGFNNATTGLAIIHGYGTIYNNVTYNIVNIYIHDNYFADNSADKNNPNDIGRTLIQFSKFSNVRVCNNRSDLSRVFLETYDGWDLTVTGNQITRSAASGIYLSGIYRVTISGNVIESTRRPFEFLECYDVNATNNVMINVKGNDPDGTFDYGLRLRNMQFFILSNNIIRTYDNTIEFGIYLYQTNGYSTNKADNIFVTDNIITGFGTQDIRTDGVITNLTQR